MMSLGLTVLGVGEGGEGGEGGKGGGKGVLWIVDLAHKKLFSS